MARGVTALLAGWLLLGAAHIALLPPWEGFDETAHYSRVQQIVTERRLPSRETSRLSADIVGYAAVAPMPYDTAPRSSFTYETFFAGDDASRARARALVHDPPLAPRRFVPTEIVNWERKHPPLAYLALAPVFASTETLPLSWHLLALRLAAFVPAWLALALVAWACLREAHQAHGAARARWLWAAVGVAVWPACFPAWFADLARLGNDGWAALVASVLWLVMARQRRDAASVRTAVLLGALLGVGWLTKAYFVAMTPAVAAWTMVAADQRQPWTRRARAATVVALLGAGIGAWWYADNLQPYLNVLLARRSGGVVAAVDAHFTTRAWLRGVAALVASAAWPGSWSFARPAYIWFVPLAVSVLLAAAAIVRGAWRAPRDDARWIPVWLAGPVVAGLVYYVFVRVASTGEGRVAAGYYLHVLAGPLGAALGMGVAGPWARPALRRTAGAFLAYALAFAAVVSWAQLLLFAGLLAKSDDKFYVVAGAGRLPAGFGVPEALHRLEVLALPWVAVPCWLAGAAVAAGALIALGRHLPAATPAHGASERAGLRTTHAIR